MPQAGWGEGGQLWGGGKVVGRKIQGRSEPHDQQYEMLRDLSHMASNMIGDRRSPWGWGLTLQYLFFQFSPLLGTGTFHPGWPSVPGLLFLLCSGLSACSNSRPPGLRQQQAGVVGLLYVTSAVGLELGRFLTPRGLAIWIFFLTPGTGLSLAVWHLGIEELALRVPRLWSVWCVGAWYGEVFWV